jgi:ElaB/YqjD/DUF883 family membrane-anchored ribosome-binding protein
MGQATTDLSAQEREIDQLRGRTEALVRELEARLGGALTRARTAVAQARRITDIRQQIRAHPRAALGVGLAVGVASLALSAAIRRRRVVRRPVGDLRRRVDAARAVLGAPAQGLPRSLLGTVLRVAATTLVAAWVRGAVERHFPPRAPRPLPAHSA